MILQKNYPLCAGLGGGDIKGERRSDMKTLAGHEHKVFLG